jgi:O-methyltransferase
MEYKGVTIYQTPEEVENLRKLVRETNSLKEPIAEIGVFEGASALIIREETDRELYLYDTFEGFPDQLDKSDSPRYFVGDCKGSLELVEELFENDENTHVIQGTFPKTAIDKKYSFVHLDVDIYKSTKDALLYCLPKMEKGGIILIHDYPAHDGVKKAVDELNLKVTVLGGRQAYYINE